MARLMGREDDALRHFAYAVDKGPENAEAFAYLGDLYRSQGDYASAGPSLDQAIDLDPELAIAHHFRGLLHLDLKSFPEAIQAFDLAISLDPNLEEAVRSRDEVLQALGADGEVPQDRESNRRQDDP